MPFTRPREPVPLACLHIEDAPVVLKTKACSRGRNLSRLWGNRAGFSRLSCLFVFVCMSVWVCMSVSICMHLGAHECGGQVLRHLLLFETRYPLAWNSAKQAGLAGQWAPEICLSPPCQHISPCLTSHVGSGELNSGSHTCKVIDYLSHVLNLWLAVF